MTCLGISIGATVTGVAVLKDDLLLARNIHKYTDTWSTKKLKIITNRYRQYIEKYNVTDIVVKVPPSSQHTDQIKLIIKYIEDLAAEHNCAFDLILKRELKDFALATSTRELIRYTCVLYPELAQWYLSNTKLGNSYYTRMFEAVLSAHVYRTRKQLRFE